ncbi:hypothetical protein Trydic_g19850 [Trypoxylus dichotomus]
MDSDLDELLSMDKYINLPDLFLKGDDIQKLSIIQALPQLVRIDQQATFSRIVPKIQQELPKASSEFQVTTSQIFRVLIEKELPVNLLGAVIQGVDSRDPVVSAAWMDTLLSVIPLLNESVIKNEIIPLIMIKSQLNQPVIQRVAGCRIIGKIATHKTLKPADIKKDILPFVHSLCQDCSIEVRAVMCMQLPFVAGGMGIGVVKTQLLPCFVELASDNAPLVREAAVLTLVNLFPYIEKELIESTIIPLIKKLCEKCTPEDNISSIIASQYGAILENIMPSLSNDDKMWFLTYYRILAKTGFESRPGGMPTVDASKDVVCRENCASNLPAVAKFVSAMIPQHMDVLYSIFRDLAGDPCYIVRRAVAGCIHEIAQILGAQNRMLKADFVRLLRDDAEDVLQMLVPNLKSTLSLLAQFGFLSKDRTDQTTMEISRAVLKCQIELAKGYNWRLLATFIEQLECLPLCMPSDFIHQHFTPIILGNAANGRVKPVRYQAIRTLLIFLRYNRKDNQQKWLRDALINQFCYSDSCYTRQIYVKLCFYALEIFSSKYFKEYFFQPLLCLAEDPISNVRYSFISILPNLKLLTLLPPIDTKYKVILQDAITRLETREKEKYVVQHLKNTLRDVQLVSLIGNKEFQQRDMAKQEQEAAFNTPTPEKQIATITAHAPMKPKVNAAASGRPGRRPSLVRSATASKTTPSGSTTIDMNFLKQHFYIDAGINLSTTVLHANEASVNNVNSTLQSNSTFGRSTSPTTINTIDTTTATNITTTTASIATPRPTIINVVRVTDEIAEENIAPNMTDDVKVNLRRKRVGKNSAGGSRPSDSLTDVWFLRGGANKSKAAKRHSSAFTSFVYLATGNDAKEGESGRRQSEKRRSLNIAASSRIPVCVRKRDSFAGSRLNRTFRVDDATILTEISSLNIRSNEHNDDDDDDDDDHVGRRLRQNNTSVDGSTKTSNLPIAIRKPNK